MVKDGQGPWPHVLFYRKSEGLVVLDPGLPANLQSCPSSLAEISRRSLAPKRSRTRSGLQSRGWCRKYVCLVRCFGAPLHGHYVSTVAASKAFQAAGQPHRISFLTSSIIFSDKKLCSRES